jgi:HD-GYP domain-containing protein (c-di-GMP phosphodiesterase class II)
MDINRFNNYLFSIDKSLRIMSDEEFLTFNKKLYSLIRFSKEKKRKELDGIFDATLKIKDLGASLEAAEILYNDYIYFLEKNDRIKAYKRACYAISHGVLRAGSPFFIDFMYRMIKEVEKHCKYKSFLAFFLNIEGIYNHIHFKYKKARSSYNKALEIIKDISSEQFYRDTGYKKTLYISLIKNNISDIDLQILYRNGYDKNLANEIQNNIQDVPKEDEYFYIITHLTLAELLAFTEQKYKADKIFADLNRIKKPVHRKWIESVKKRIIANSYYLNGQYEKALDYAMENFSISIKTNLIIEEKISLNFYFNLLIKIMNRDSKSLFSYKNQKMFTDNILRVLTDKDWYTGRDHSREVQNLSVKIGEYMNLPSNKMAILSLGSLFHDIGKLNIGWFTLNKVFPLSELDWELIRTHCAEGEKLINRLGLDSCSYIVRDHHERLDGSGYPNGIINLDRLTQITVLADIFEASTTPNRKYRKAKSKETAIKEIKSFSNVLVCKEVIDTFLHVIEI